MLPLHTVGMHTVAERPRTALRHTELADVGSSLVGQQAYILVRDSDSNLIIYVNVMWDQVVISATKKNKME